MLNINYSSHDAGAASSLVQPASGYPADVLNFQHMLMVSCAMHELQPVALRCEALLDAMELDSHGYHHGYFERHSDATEDTFVTLNRLGLTTVAYFCDLKGASFDVAKMAALAARHNVTLCKVLLPFCPTNFALWDESQWRIFDTRLTLALHRKLCKPLNNLFNAGGQRYAYIQ